MPFVPHDEAGCTAQMLAGSGAPAGTSRQRPIDAARAHDWHEPEQALAQQTPWAQKPEAHSALSEQNDPFVFLPHDPWALHVLGARHASLSEQAAKQRAPLQA
jgi:hypothetical protein